MLTAADAPAAQRVATAVRKQYDTPEPTVRVVDVGDANGQGEAVGEWRALHACRPSHVDAEVWGGLFEFVLYKASLLLGGHNVRPFVEDLCAAERFDRARTDGCTPLLLS